MRENSGPIKAPIKREAAKSHPVSDKADNAQSRAIILQPAASLAPNPIKNPPIIPAKSCFLFLIFLTLNSEANKVAKAAPMIIPILRKDPPSFRIGVTMDSPNGL